MYISCVIGCDLEAHHFRLRHLGEQPEGGDARPCARPARHAVLPTAELPLAGPIPHGQYFLRSTMSEMKDSNAAALVGNPEPTDQSGDNSMPSAQQQEEAVKKKFGGLMPKKPPLISKDHERAYFDSADWALGKQGVAKPKGPLEALRPKLQPTRQQQQQRSRRSIYTSSENEDGDGAGAEDMKMS
ncbi:uncharacterized protein LOC133884286 isoform X2 [Phragmites australis]|uniref:uncharacterized protein LOC133884286 isoform X2 n=1 Tax=Phragmites australis TaxID=29695 RepID=UPI002D787829|nr:uncharacterized protein LOC133884286 isoform X2 [Phragmites australis]